ncbi:hypothetical protein [Methanosphaera cuniculi]|nr:hypothetical protein [Methanosphaera cuniculi]
MLIPPKIVEISAIKALKIKSSLNTDIKNAMKVPIIPQIIARIAKI